MSSLNIEINHNAMALLEFHCPAALQPNNNISKDQEMLPKTDGNKTNGPLLPLDVVNEGADNAVYICMGVLHLPLG